MRHELIIEVFNPTSTYTGTVPGDGEQAQRVAKAQVLRSLKSLNGHPLKAMGLKLKLIDGFYGAFFFARSFRLLQAFHQTDIAKLIQLRSELYCDSTGGFNSSQVYG